MIHLHKQSIQNKEQWQSLGISLPEFSVDALCTATQQEPQWLHFGEGNLFRAFVAMIAQKLANSGLSQTGITVAATYDKQTLDLAYTPYDNLSLQVTAHADGTLEKTVVGSVCESIKAYEAEGWARLHDIFAMPSLQMVSFTITEKGYGIKTLSGAFSPVVSEDIKNGIRHPVHTIAMLASLLYRRYQKGAFPIALVSMDNFSHNGDRLQSAVLEIAREWNRLGFVDNEFIAYLCDSNKVSFPWSMIDKITPRPSEKIAAELQAIGFGSTEIYVTETQTYIAPFVNTEPAEYLVIEDAFPNGRPPLEQVGVLLTERETVDKIERMKVCTCLNPLHTALAIFGCLLGYQTIADEMKDVDLVDLVKKIGYSEGLPVVVDPQVINPEAFLAEVLAKRFPNPYIPDTPQRIATDTSQKMAIRFGETIKLYRDREDLNVLDLHYIPLTIAAWCRYLLAVDEEGKPMTISPDPLLAELQSHISSIRFGEIESIGQSLVPILSNERIFGVDLYSVGLGQKIEGFFAQMIAGKGAVRAILAKTLSSCPVQQTE